MTRDALDPDTLMHRNEWPFRVAAGASYPSGAGGLPPLRQRLEGLPDLASPFVVHLGLDAASPIGTGRGEAERFAEPAVLCANVFRPSEFVVSDGAQMHTVNRRRFSGGAVAATRGPFFQLLEQVHPRTV